MKSTCFLYFLVFATGLTRFRSFEIRFCSNGFRLCRNVVNLPLRTIRSIRHSSGRFLPLRRSPSRSFLWWRTSRGPRTPPSSATTPCGERQRQRSRHWPPRTTSESIRRNSSTNPLYSLTAYHHWSKTPTKIQEVRFHWWHSQSLISKQISKEVKSRGFI